MAIESNSYKKAREFADTAYAAAMNDGALEYRKKQAELRNKMAAAGSVLSSGMSRGSAELMGQHIDGLLRARLQALLEGYDLYGVPIDDELAARTLREIIELRELKIRQTMQVTPRVDAGPVTPEIFAQLVDSESQVCPASVRLEIERWRMRPVIKDKAAATVTNIHYHLHGHNSRVNVNSTDNSVNSVSVSSTQLFANMRTEIAQGVQETELQQEILDRLNSLEQAQDQPSFGQRYVDFIATAADHMTLLAPFIPALTELLSKTLR